MYGSSPLAHGALKVGDHLALEAAEQVTDPYAKSYAMGELSKKFSAAGLHAKAQELLDQAEHLAEKAPQPDMRAEALENIRTLKRKLPVH